MAAPNRKNLPSLMSPPEAAPHDSFSPSSHATQPPHSSRPSQSAQSQHKSHSSHASRSSHDHPIDSHMKSLFNTPQPPSINNNAAPNFPISPPVSPATKIAKSVTSHDHSPLVRDPILYPHAEPQSAQQAPLFATDDALAAQRAVKEHVAARVESLFRAASPPRPSDYALALEFKSQVARAFSLNPRLWLERERGYLKAQRQGRRYTAIAPARSHHAAAAAGVRKAPALPRAPKAPRAVKAPRPAPDPTKKVVREDKDFNALPDYSPPLSSLPEKPNSLKVEWRGVPLDLADDPHAHLLDADEILLASNLRLDCATYLTSKRRIFIKRIEALRIGKEFRKTDAQQACKIDVNKASKLWQAFEKVGWLNPNWVAQYV